ncbi:unnamed protein product [Caretta caretta]
MTCQEDGLNSSSLNRPERGVCMAKEEEIAGGKTGGDAGLEKSSDECWSSHSMPQALGCYFLGVVTPKTDFKEFIRGYLPSPQNVPVKSSRSIAQTMAPPKLFSNSHFACERRFLSRVVNASVKIL